MAGRTNRPPLFKLRRALDSLSGFSLRPGSSAPSSSLIFKRILGSTDTSANQSGGVSFFFFLFRKKKVPWGVKCSWHGFGLDLLALFAPFALSCLPPFLEFGWNPLWHEEWSRFVWPCSPKAGPGLLILECALYSPQLILHGGRGIEAEPEDHLEFILG